MTKPISEEDPAIFNQSVRYEHNREHKGQKWGELSLTVADPEKSPKEEAFKGEVY